MVQTTMPSLEYEQIMMDVEERNQRLAMKKPMKSAMKKKSSKLQAKRDEHKDDSEKSTSTFKSTLKKRVYSKEYHRVLGIELPKGKKHSVKATNDAKEKARKAARKKCRQIGVKPSWWIIRWHVSCRLGCYQSGVCRVLRWTGYAYIQSCSLFAEPAMFIYIWPHAYTRMIILCYCLMAMRLVSKYGLCIGKATQWVTCAVCTCRSHPQQCSQRVELVAVASFVRTSERTVDTVTLQCFCCVCKMEIVLSCVLVVFVVDDDS